LLIDGAEPPATPMRNIPFHLSEALSQATEAPSLPATPSWQRPRSLIAFLAIVVIVAVAVGAVAWFLL
jgi:hypothetical protein